MADCTPKATDYKEQEVYDKQMNYTYLHTPKSPASSLVNALLITANDSKAS